MGDMVPLSIIRLRYFNYSLFKLKVMCQKSALQCQLTCLYALYTVNPSPLPPHSNTHCHESTENFLYKINKVLGKLPILINYCTQKQK